MHQYLPDVLADAVANVLQLTETAGDEANELPQESSWKGHQKAIDLAIEKNAVLASKLKKGSRRSPKIGE